jgi:hypothetical protein
MNNLFSIGLAAWIVMVLTSAIQSEEIVLPQLDVLENPRTFTFESGSGSKDKFEPNLDYVVVFGSSKAEMATAFRNPEQYVGSLLDGQAKYAIVVPPSALKSVNELRKAAKTNALPVIHRAYVVRENVRAPLLFFPVGLIEVELKHLKDVEKINALATKLGLVEVVSDNRKPGVRLPKSPVRKTFELAGKSKYAFVFDLAQEIGRKDFVRFARPVAPIAVHNSAGRG